MIVLTNREACRTDMRIVVTSIPNWRTPETRIAFADTFADVHRLVLRETNMTDQLVVIDLGSIGRRGDELRHVMYAMREAHPWLNIALLSPLLDPEIEVHAIDSVRSITHVTVVQHDDMTNVTYWKELLRNVFLELRAAQIEADLMVVGVGAAAAFFDDPEVRLLLRAATVARSVSDLIPRFAPNRVTLNRRFKRRLGRSPKELLALFRLLWAACLRADGRTPAQIAHFLGYRDTDHAGMLLGRKLGLKKEQINALGYPELVKWVAECCTAQRHASVKELATQVARKVRAALKRSATSAALAVVALLGANCGGEDLAEDVDRGMRFATLGVGFLTAAVVLRKQHLAGIARSVMAVALPILTWIAITEVQTRRIHSQGNLSGPRE